MLNCAMFKSGYTNLSCNLGLVMLHTMYVLLQSNNGLLNAMNLYGREQHRLDFKRTKHLRLIRADPVRTHQTMTNIPDSKVHGANMGPTWVLSAPDGPMLAP